MFDEITEGLIAGVSRDWMPKREYLAKRDEALRTLIQDFAEKLRGRPFIQVDLPPQGALGVGAGEHGNEARDVSFFVSRGGVTVSGGSLPSEEVEFHFDPAISDEVFVYGYKFRAQLMGTDRERNAWVRNMPKRVPGMAVLADLLAERMKR